MIIAKNNVHGKTLIFCKTIATKPISKSRLVFAEARIKIFAAKIKRVKKTLPPAELHL